MHTESRNGTAVSKRCTHRALLCPFQEQPVGDGVSLTGSLCPSAEMSGGKDTHGNQVRYENQVTAIQVPEEDFTVMIEMDYQERCAAADDPASITRRTSGDSGHGNQPP